VREVCADEAATTALASRLAAGFLPGDVVLLSGPLGAGKTTFVRGALRAMGWDGPVRSPTFSLAVEYPTRPPALHLDLYRLSAPEDLGVEEAMERSVTFVEWPERDPGIGGGRPAWSFAISFEGEGRAVEWAAPSRPAVYCAP
jgi:tRNA threonylcarbamoyladenosine biosynthesis protein TsaE